MNPSDTQAIVDITRESVRPKELEAGSIYLVTDADGTQRVVDTDGYSEMPRWTKRTVTFRAVDAFAQYLTKHFDPDALEVWADVDHRELVAVLDAPEDYTSPRRCAHVAKLVLQHTPEWLGWREMSGKLSSQGDFAEWIEERAADIVEPDPATMLELSQTFQAKTRVQFEQASFLADGRRALEYREDVEARAGAKGQIEIPAMFALGVRVFVHGEPYKVLARLRYRMRDGALSIGYKLVDPDAVVRAAVDDVIDALQPMLPDNVPVWHGKPSA